MSDNFKFAKNSFLNIEFEALFTNISYKAFLRKLKAFSSYYATVGVHDKEGRLPVSRKYKALGSKSKYFKTSGRSHRMSLIKLAYQNEFGAGGEGAEFPAITIQPRYRVATFRKKQIINTFNARIIQTTETKRSIERNEQGYLLRDKSGKFVAYFKPNSKIRIPKRSFLRKIVKEPDKRLQGAIENILLKTFVKKGYTPRTTFTKIARLTQYKVKQNIAHSTPRNAPLTIKAKGFNSPLIDEQNRLFNAIKFKVYKGESDKFKSQLGMRVDKLLKSAEQYNNFGIISQKTSITNTFLYKRYNPNTITLL